VRSVKAHAKGLVKTETPYSLPISEQLIAVDG
jgi:hypothetical protein